MPLTVRSQYEKGFYQKKIKILMSDFVIIHVQKVISIIDDDLK